MPTAAKVPNIDPISPSLDGHALDCASERRFAQALRLTPIFPLRFLCSWGVTAASIISVKMLAGNLCVRLQSPNFIINHCTTFSPSLLQSLLAKMQTPCIDVSKLAPSTSFYAALLQSLGLRYLTTESLEAGPDFAVFGTSQGTLLKLRQVAESTTIHPSSIRISAPCLRAVEAFYQSGVTANPASTSIAERVHDKASLFDLDGNKIQAVHTDPNNSSEFITGQFTLILTPVQTTHRPTVLAWSKTAPAASCSQGYEAGPPALSSETIDNTTSSSNSNISTIFGALLGVAAGAAAGAAITYGVMSTKQDAAASTGFTGERWTHTRLPVRTVDTDMTTGVIDKERKRDPPSKSQRITFKDAEPSSCGGSSGPLSTSLSKKGAISEIRGGTEGKSQEYKRSELVRVPAAIDTPMKKHVAGTSSSNRLSGQKESRRLGPPARSASQIRPNTNAIEDKVFKRHDELVVSSKSTLPSSASHVQASKHTSAHRKGTRSSFSSKSTQKVSHSNDKHNYRKEHAISSSKSYNLQRSVEKQSQQVSASVESSTVQSNISSHSSSRTMTAPPSLTARNDINGVTSNVIKTKSHHASALSESAAQYDGRSYVSARNVPLPSSQIGTSEFYDTVCHVSVQDFGPRASSVAKSSCNDRRSHISARNIPLPSSQVGTSEFYDTVSHVSSIKTKKVPTDFVFGNDGDRRSQMSTRSRPLPCSQGDIDNRSRGAPSYISARNIALPISTTGTIYGTITASHLSARNVALPGSFVGSSHANWDDDGQSIAPSDSISCIGSK